MSDLFPHRVLPAKTNGFVFAVVPEDSDIPELVEAAQQAENLLNEKFDSESATGITPKEAQDGEEVEMVYADAITLLEDNDFPLADGFVVLAVVVVGDLVVVTASIGDSADEDDEEEEESDEDYD